jgi:hypothetical protein
MTYFSASTCTIEYLDKYKSGEHLQTEEKKCIRAMLC